LELLDLFALPALAANNKFAGEGLIVLRTGSAQWVCLWGLYLGQQKCLTSSIGFAAD
jgi:hypothetical protein